MWNVFCAIFFGTLLLLCTSCSGVGGDDMGKSQLPWARPAAWENDRTLMPSDWEYSSHGGGKRGAKSDNR
ncbi:MAG: hypothetical protein LBT64_01690 [Puniceicoccales bacterium]|nr:hypothetical protein [Puniceicoccales bacterium]